MKQFTVWARPVSGADDTEAGGSFRGPVELRRLIELSKSSRPLKSNRSPENFGRRQLDWAYPWTAGIHLVEGWRQKAGSVVKGKWQRRHDGLGRPNGTKELRALVLSANSVDTIAGALYRTSFAIRRRANTLRLPLRKIARHRGKSDPPPCRARAEAEEMRAVRLKELEEMVAKLLVAPGKLAAVQDRNNV
jgi:hypothetical protein